MKKEITLILEIEDDEQHFPSDEEIQKDLECEINCCSHFYEVKKAEIKLIN